MSSRRNIWSLFAKRFGPLQSRTSCTKNSNKIKKPNSNNCNSTSSKEVSNDVKESSSMSRADAYKQLENLNFTTAAKILFNGPSNKKKFGLDFHLVQLFFACMPSLAVYLVALYARSEMRRMEAEQKKSEEEAKAKEMELKAIEEKEATSDPQLLEVKVRLDKLEEAVKEIVVESKKISSEASGDSQVDDGEKKQVTTGSNRIDNRTDAGSSTRKGDSHKKVSQGSTPSAPVTEASLQNQKSNQNVGHPPDAHN